MRGITGILDWTGAPVSREEAARLLERLAVRPPDRKQLTVAGAAAFGHVVWATAPEDRHEAQPLCSRDGSTWLVTDAVLENRDELAAVFGWTPGESASRPDSAFVLAAYEKWGEACPSRLEGRWALAVWRAREQRFFAAVDAFACRPFYYARRGQTFAFATTLRALLALPGLSHELHDGILADFLLHTTRHPGATLYRAIATLPAAHALVVTATGETLTRYWQADPGKTLTFESDEACQAAFRAELERTIAAALRVEGAIGAMVSGGLDSSAIAALAGQKLAEQGRRLQVLHQLPPPSDPRRRAGRELNESGHVRQLAAQMPHVDFHFLPVPERHISLEAWDRFFDEHCVPTRAPVFAEEDAVARAARELGLRRVLFGFGGNYALSLEAASSPYFLELAVQLRWGQLRRELTARARQTGTRTRALIRRHLLQPLWPVDRRLEARFALLRAGFGADFRRRTDFGTGWRRPTFWPWRRHDFNVRRHIALALNELMPQQGPAAPAPIDSEYPYDGYSPWVNRRLNELCLAIPAEQQIRDGRDRRLLREAMRGLLPEAVRERRTRGLPTPYAWVNARALQAVLPEALEELRHSRLATAYVDLSFLRRCAEPDGPLLGQLGPTQFASLFSTAWFLRWLERKGPAGA